MTVRDWWYKTAAVDVLCKMVDNSYNNDICVRNLLKPYDEECPCPVFEVNGYRQLDCHKCMENLLNEKYEK